MRGRRPVTAPVGEKTASAKRKDTKTAPAIENLCQQGLFIDKKPAAGDEETPTKDSQKEACKGTVKSKTDCEKGTPKVVSGKCLSDFSGRLPTSARDSKSVFEHSQTASSFVLASEVLQHKELESQKNPNVDNTITIMNSKAFSSSNSADKLVLDPATALESLITKPPDNGDDSAMSSSVEGLTADKSTVSGLVISAEPPLPSVKSPVVRNESSSPEVDLSSRGKRNARLPRAEFSSSAMTNLMRGGSGLLLPGSSAKGSVDSVPGIETHQRSASSPAGVDLSHFLPPPRHVEVGIGAPVEQWSVEYVCRWLAGLGWREDVRRRFEAQQVTGEVLLSLTERDFKEELDLRLFGERRSLALSIARLKGPSTSPLATPSATPPSSGSPQHSPATHHHYYHHAPPQPTPGHHQHCYCYNNVDNNTVGINNGHHHHPYSAVLANDNGTNSGGDNTTNGGDSGVGAGDWEAPPVGATCGCPACHHHLPTSPNAVAHKLLKQRKNRHRCKSRRHYYSSDSDDEAEEEEDKEDDDKDEVPDGASKSPPSGVLGSAPGASLGANRRGAAGGGGGYGTASRLRSEYLKTAISCFYMFLVTWITAIVMVFVHDRVPDRARHPPLPDIFLDNVPHIPWAFQLCEVTILILTGTLVAILCFHKHRCIIMRRFAALSGTVFLLRCATMFITSLSVPGSHLQCSPRERRSVWRQVEQAWVIWQGGGLSIKGVRTCGDYMFSGHTTALTMLNFFITEYTPRRMYYVHISSWVLNMFGVFFVLAAHEHYSIDVFIAFYITSRMFLYYHSLANNRALHQRDSFRTKIWFPMFSFFESNINGIVPNEYNNPFAVSNLLWAVQICVMPIIWLLDKGKVTLIALSGVAGWRDITAGIRLGGRSEGGSCGGSDRSVKGDCVGDNAEGASQASKPTSDDSGAAGSVRNVRTAGDLQSEGESTQKPIDMTSSRRQNTDHNNADPSALLDERIFSVDSSKCSVEGHSCSATSIATRSRGPTPLSTTTQSGPSSSRIVPSFSSNLKATSSNLKGTSSKLAGNGAAAKPEKSARGNTNKKKLH